MLRKGLLAPIAVLMCLIPAAGIFADGVDSKEAAAFHEAAALSENYNSFEAEIATKMSSSEGGIDSDRNVHLQVSGLKENGKLNTAIETKSKTVDNSNWYKDGFYYSTNNGKKLKEKMSEADMKNLLNGYVLMDLGEADFKALSSEKAANGEVTYYFTLQEKSLEKYLSELASSVGANDTFSIKSATGSMDVDESGKIASRTMDISVTTKVDNKETSLKVSTVTKFPKTSQVTVSFPSDLDQFQANTNPNIESSGEVAMSGTMYLNSSGVNLRAAATSNSKSLAQLIIGTPVQVIGYISGWYHVNTVGMTGYIYEKYLSWTAPNAPAPVVSTASVSSATQYLPSIFMIQCPDCGGYFQEGDEYRYHVCPALNVDDDDMVLCPYCNQYYEAGNIFRNHICPARDQVLWDTIDYDGPSSTAYSPSTEFVQCPDCGGWFEEGIVFRNHVCPAKMATTEYVQCPDCGGWFEEGNIFRNHVCPAKSTTTDDTTEYAQCPDCGGWFEVGNIFRNHVCPAKNTTTDDTTDTTEYVQCPDCGGWFEEGNIFRNHVCPAKSTSAEYVQCPDCGGWFEEGNIFRNHVCPAKNNEADGPSSTAYSPSTGFVQCPDCGGWFEEGIVFRNHVCPAKNNDYYDTVSYDTSDDYYVTASSDDYDYSYDYDFSYDYDYDYYDD